MAGHRIIHALVRAALGFGSCIDVFAAEDDESTAGSQRFIPAKELCGATRHVRRELVVA